VPDATQGGPTIVGRYVLEGEVASGGMATIHYGRRQDEPLPGTTVAVKRVHPHLARDKKFASMFIDEARLVSRIRHPNVIRTLDIIASENECLLVMEYIHGESVARLMRLAESKGIAPRLDVISSFVCGALDGLQAAHDATNAAGVPLNVVHRDISPQNIMVGADGLARILDFGVAKAAGSVHVTRDGEIKGKLAYMAPEQLGAQPLDRRTDVYAAGVVLWEAITQRPLFDGDSEAALIASVLRQEIPVPSSIVPGLSPALDAVVMRSLAPDRTHRFSTAREMALALEAASPRADVREVAAWIDALAGDDLRERQRLIQGAAGSGARRAAAPNAPSVGVTEVFFTGRGSSPERERVTDAPMPTATRASAALETRIVHLEGGMRDVTRHLPERLRGPVQRYRWYLLGLAGLLVVALGYCALSPTPPPAAGITAGPEGVPPGNR
jgi:hypothetical protein